MKAYVWYLPPAVFLLWGLVWQWRHPRFLRDPSVVRHPQRGVWHIGRFLSADEWTDKGQRLRWQFVRHIAIGVLLALAGMGVASYLEATL